MGGLDIKSQPCGCAARLLLRRKPLRNLSSGLALSTLLRMASDNGTFMRRRLTWRWKLQFKVFLRRRCLFFVCSGMLRTTIFLDHVCKGKRDIAGCGERAWRPTWTTYITILGDCSATRGTTETGGARQGYPAAPTRRRQIEAGAAGLHHRLPRRSSIGGAFGQTRAGLRAHAGCRPQQRLHQKVLEDAIRALPRSRPATTSRGAGTPAFELQVYYRPGRVHSASPSTPCSTCPCQKGTSFSLGEVKASAALPLGFKLEAPPGRSHRRSLLIDGGRTLVARTPFAFGTTATPKRPRFYRLPRRRLARCTRTPATSVGQQGDVIATVGFTVMGIPCLQAQRPNLQAGQQGLLLPGGHRRPGRDRPACGTPSSEMAAVTSACPAGARTKWDLSWRITPRIDGGLYRPRPGGGQTRLRRDDADDQDRHRHHRGRPGAAEQGGCPAGPAGLSFPPRPRSVPAAGRAAAALAMTLTENSAIAAATAYRRQQPPEQRIQRRRPAGCRRRRCRQKPKNRFWRMLRMVARDRVRARPAGRPSARSCPRFPWPDVGAGSHGDADIGRRQRRVVDAVAGHRHHASSRPAALHDRVSAFCSAEGHHLVDAKLAAHRVGGGARHRRSA